MSEQTQWPHGPWFTRLAIVVSLASLCWFVKLQRDRMPLVEREDLNAFIRVTLPALPGWGTYTILLNAAGDNAVPSDNGELRPYTYSPDRQKLKAFLQSEVYGQSLWRVLQPPLFAFLAIFFGLVRVGRALDVKRSGDRWIRGPQLVSRWQWNVRTGLRRSKAFYVETKWKFRLTWKLRIEPDKLAHHICIRGVTGTGKTIIERCLANQFDQRGMPIVYTDPKCEFVSERYREGIDWILNPADARCPYWALDEEVLSELYGMAWACAAFPNEPGENPFFSKRTRNIAGRLFAEKDSTTENMARWLADESQLDMRLHGTDLAKALAKNASEMRAGFIAHLSEFGRSLRLWPTQRERDERGLRTFSIHRWAKERKGSIFFSSTGEIKDAIRPVQRMLLDLLLLKVQSDISAQPKIAFLLSEIAQWHHLPQLEPTISLQRSSGNPVVITFQEWGQIEEHWGKLAPAITSGPYTQFVFATSEEQSATKAAGLLGKQDVERIRESRSAHWWSRHQHTYSTERVTQYVASPGEIQSLKNCHFYMSQRGSIVKGVAKYRDPITRAERLIPRDISTTPAIEVSERVASPIRSRYTQRKLKLESPANIT